MWMPLREAVARAGSIEALLPMLRNGAIKARAAVMYGSYGGVKDNSVGPSWWGNAQDIDVATGRARFTDFVLIANTGDGPPPTTYDIHAVGIELDADAVKALWPDPPKPPGRKSGKKPSPVWQQIFEHFDPVVATKGQFPSLGSATRSVERWLTTKNKGLHPRTIGRGITKYRPGWIAA